MKRAFRNIILTLAVIGLLASNSFAAWPSDSVRTKNWGSETLTDTDLEAQYDIIHTWINDALDETSGHKHDGTANEGVLIDLNDDAGVIGVKNNLDVPNGGTGVTTLTDGGILLGSGTGDVTVMSVLADGEIVVGDGTTDPVALACFTSSTGDLKHECGGVEADISAIAKGGIVTGTGTGTMGVLAAGTDGQYLQYDSGQSSGFSAVSVGSTFTSATTWSNTTTSGAISITAGTIYSAILIVEADANTDVYVRFNSDTASSTDHTFGVTGVSESATEFLTGSTGANQIIVNDGIIQSAKWMFSEFMVTTKPASSSDVAMFGQGYYFDNGGSTTQFSIAGEANIGAAVTSFTVVTTGQTDGAVYLRAMSKI